MGKRDSLLERIASGARRVLPAAMFGLGSLVMGGCSVQPGETDPREEVSDNEPNIAVNQTPSYPAKIISDADFYSSDGNICFFVPSVKNLKKGDYIVWTEESGGLRKIIDDPRSSGRLVQVTTERASVADVVENGSFQFVAGKADLRARDIRLVDWSHSFEDYQIVNGGPVFTAFLDGEFDASLDLKLDFEVKSHRLERLSCSLEGTVSSNINLNAELLEFGLDGGEDKTILDRSWYFYGLVGGWLPVVVELNGKLDVGGAALMNGAGKINADYTASSSLKFGSKYERGNGWSPVLEESFEINHDNREFCISGRAAVGGTIGPKFTVKVYGVEVASTGIEGYWGANMYGANCWSDEGIEQGYRLELGAGARIPLKIGAEVFDEGIEIYQNDDLLGDRAKSVWTYGNFEMPYPGSEEFYGDSYFLSQSSGGGSSGGGSGGGGSGEGGSGGGSSGGGGSGGSGGGTGGGGGGQQGVVTKYEGEPNDSLTTANAFTLTARDYGIKGSHRSDSDIDYFVFNYPSDVNYGYYFRSGGSNARVVHAVMDNGVRSLAVESKKGSGHPYEYELGLVTTSFD